MALVAVLWVVLLLSILATTVATESVEGRRVAARNAQAAQLDAWADSAIRKVLLRLLANLRKPELPQPIPGSIEIDNAQVRVQIEREAARLDLNTVDENLLFAYFRVIGMNAEGAKVMTNRIRDWQDADDNPREGSLERDEYAALGIVTRPRNGPMETVEEIRLVAGASELTDARLAGLTVYSHQKEPESGGPELVGRALQEASREQLGGRSRAALTNSNEGHRITAGSLLRIHACAGASAPTRCREAVVRLTGSTQEPVQVFLWRSTLSGGS